MASSPAALACLSPCLCTRHIRRNQKSMTIPSPKPGARARARRAQSIDQSRAGVVGSAPVDFVGCRGVSSSEDLLLFSLAAPCLFPHSFFSNHPLASFLRSHAFQDRRRSSARRLLFLLSFSPFLDIRSTTASTPYLVLRDSAVLIHSRFVSNHSPILNWHATPFITH